MRIPDLLATAPPPNFVDPESLSREIVTVNAIFLTLMLLIVLARLYTTIWIARSFGIEAVACVLAAVGAVAYTALLIDVPKIAERHIWDIPLSSFTSDLVKRFMLPFELVYIPSIASAKLALFLLYLRIFSVKQGIRYLIYFGMISYIVTVAVTSIIYGYYCFPRLGQSWMVAQFSVRCLKARSSSYTKASVNMIIDLYLLVLPIVPVWQLQMSLWKKVGVCAIFMTGLLACVSSVVSFYYRIRLLQGSDGTWNLFEAAISAAVELDVGIICACLPHLPALFRRLKENVSASSSRQLKPRFISKAWKRFFSSGIFSKLNSKQLDPEACKASNAMYLETNILGSRPGEGRFLESGIHPRRESLIGSTNGREG